MVLSIKQKYSLSWQKFLELEILADIKPDTVLLDNQFQLPDFGSKSINASNGSNLGDYLDTYLLDDSDRTISKSGVGLR